MTTMTEAYEEAFTRCGISREQQSVGSFNFVEAEGLVEPESGERGSQLYPIPAVITFEDSPYKLDAQTGSLISESARVSEREVVIGRRAIVGPGVYLGPRSVIGQCSRVMSSVLEDVVIGDNVDIASGWSVHANVIIEDGVKVGARGFVGSHGKLRLGTVIGDSFTAYEYVEVGPAARIGDSVHLGPGSIVGTMGEIGNDCSLIGDDSIGNHSAIADSVRISTGVDIGSFSHVGKGAQIGRGTSIGDNSQVVAGTSVPPLKRFRKGVVIYQKKKYIAKGVWPLYYSEVRNTS